MTERRGYLKSRLRLDRGANPQVDAWLEQAAIENDHATRVKLWHNVQRQAMHDVPHFPLVMAAWQTVSNVRIADHTTTAHGFAGSMAQMRVVG